MSFAPPWNDDPSVIKDWQAWCAHEVREGCFACENAQGAGRYCKEQCIAANCDVENVQSTTTIGRLSDTTLPVDNKPTHPSEYVENQQTATAIGIPDDTIRSVDEKPTHLFESELPEAAGAVQVQGWIGKEEKDAPHGNSRIVSISFAIIVPVCIVVIASLAYVRLQKSNVKS